VDVPHAALGSELCTEYHQRTRVFAWKRVLFGVGAGAAIRAQGWLQGAQHPRIAAEPLGWAGAVLVLALVLCSALRTPERSVERSHRRTSGLGSALSDVLCNPHARRLLGVYGVQQIGVATLSSALPYLSEYVLNTPQWTERYLLSLLVTSLLGVPIWLRLAAHLEKRSVVLISMLGVLLVIASLSVAPSGGVLFVLVLAALGGLFGAGMDVVAPSLQADIVDWDELRSGQRRDGSYFAVWALAQKSATALGLFLTAWGLDAIGFVPNAEQLPDVRLGLRILCAVVPAALFGVGALLFFGFRLRAHEHARIRRELEARIP